MDLAKLVALGAVLLLLHVPELLSTQPASKCPEGCNERGTCNEEIGRCDCPKFLDGPACSKKQKSAVMKKFCINAYTIEKCRQLLQPCLNACNGRGECVAGWCHCQRGFWGADCSLSMDPSTGKPQLLAGQGYKPRSRRPWIYVYDIPQEWSAWTNPTRMDRPLYWVFWQRLLGSGAQVADGDGADWYFIPIKLRSTSDGLALVEAIQYIRQHWPWYDRLNGKRHFVIHVGDMGRGETAAVAKEASANITWLHHFGLTQDYRFSGWKSSHRPGKDIVVPIYFSATTHHGHISLSAMHPLAVTPQRTKEFLFAGRICGDYGMPATDGSQPHCPTDRSRGYSQGVRQEVHRLHHNRPGYKVVVKDPSYGVDLLTHRFCLAPTGGGHGHRQTLVPVKGCMPVCIGDSVLQPFEPEIPWSEFSITLPQSEIPNLHNVLGNVTQERYESMQDALRCAMQHLVYSGIGGAFMQEDGRYDAFETILEILRMQQQYPGVPPEQYVKVDERFASFVNCGLHTFTGHGKQLRAKRDVLLNKLDPDRSMAAVGRDGRILGIDPSAQTGWWGLMGSDSKQAQAPPLCSQSEFDLEAKRCKSCHTWREWAKAREGINYLGYTPGGNACCDAPGLANCRRVWE